MALHVDVWSDFVCPWCFLVSTSLEKLEESHDVTVSWKAYELRPQGSPPMPEEYRARIEASQPRLQLMARTQYGVELNSGEFGIDSRAAHIGMKYAEAQGKGQEYHKRVFEAYWLEAQNIADLTILAGLAESVGLERQAFLAALKDLQFDSQVEADVQQAYEYQLRGVPALIFENKYYIAGAQPYAELVRLVEQLEAKAEQ
jgi:predicted DsbA family dithiol-disulfide isomerase